MSEKITSTLRLRMSAKDAHYGGNLVDGAHMVHLFGDVATELLIKMNYLSSMTETKVCSALMTM